MDTSEAYILQCQKATEIQAEWNPREGDWYTYWWDKAPYWEDGEWEPHWAGPLVTCRFPRMNRVDEKRVWLPRQDQLQEMADICECSDPLCWTITFRNWLANSNQVTYSMEQAWLAYVMSEKYGKQWTGEEWA